MKKVFIGMGSNQEAEIHLAMGAGLMHDLIADLSFSSCYQSKSRSYGADYLNLAAFGYCSLPWDQLRLSLKRIESVCGRIRNQKDECIIDLDLLWFEGVTVENLLPHPDLWRRSYVAVPVFELCSDAGIPFPGDPPDEAILGILSNELKLVEFKVH
jgi:2-amino-4-hydroxy-6-hydroxymethyldihydropteridine diphosphokinase